MGVLKALDPLLQPVVDNIYDEQDTIDSIVNLIKNHIEPPYSIAVNGSWGTGKTTVLKLIHDRLEKNTNEVGENEPYPTIWFNPWEYDNGGDVVLALERAIALEFKNTFEVALKELGIFGLSLVTASIDTIAKVTTQGNVSYKDIKEIGNDVRDAFGTTEYDKYEDAVMAVKKDFIELTTKKIPSQYGTKPLVIFLDDLDRCLPENAIMLLEALKNLFVVKGANVIIISGIDTGVAKSFIKKRYEGIGDNFAINYFRKIFNVTLELPNKPTAKLESYLNEYVENLLEEDAEISKKTAKLVQTLAAASGTKSLRALLNIINNYFIVMKTTNSHLPFNDILPFLFLKEVWNDFFNDVSIEAQKQFAIDREVKLQTVMDNLSALLDGNSRLKYFVTNCHEILRLNIKDIMEATLL